LVGLNVGQQRVVDERVHRPDILQSKQNAVVMGGMNIMKGVQGSLHMPSRWFIAVRGKKGMNCDEVRASQVSKPTDAANETLICFFATLESRRGVVLRRFSNGINGNAGMIRSCRKSLCSVAMRETVNKVRSKARLIEVDCYQQRSNTPREVDAQEPVDNTHEVNLALLIEKPTKEIFNCWILGEINKVVNVETQGERNGSKGY
jgi:hypothetical protein